MASNSTFPGVFECVGEWGSKFCPTASFANASQLKKQTKVCEVVRVVRSCTCFLVPILHAGYVCYYTALSQFVKFVKDRVRLLECPPVCCPVPRCHCEEKREKFITRRINNKLSSHFSFDMQAFFSFGWMKNSLSREKVFVWKKHYS